MSAGYDGQVKLSPQAREAHAEHPYTDVEAWDTVVKLQGAHEFADDLARNQHEVAGILGTLQHPAAQSSMVEDSFMSAGNAGLSMGYGSYSPLGSPDISLQHDTSQVGNMRSFGAGGIAGGSALAFSPASSLNSSAMGLHLQNASVQGSRAPPIPPERTATAGISREGAASMRAASVPAVAAHNDDLGRELNAMTLRVNKLDKLLMTSDQAPQGPGEPNSELGRILNPEPDPELDSTDPPAQQSGGCSNINLWGGPYQPKEDDTLYSYLTNFFAGGTTAHGINQSWKEENGLVRRIVWAGLFFASFVILMVSLNDVFNNYWDAATSTSVDFFDGDSTIPMVTICNSMPIRCGCEAFYDDAVMADPYFNQILPYVCRSAVALKQDYVGLKDPSGAPTGYNALENQITTLVDPVQTKLQMKAFQDKLFCDKGAYTKDWFIKSVVKGNLTALDVFMYAGYADRSKLVRYCKSSNGDTGLSESCSDDRFWAPVSFDDTYGACHTFNPCLGVPLDAECKSDGDCAGSLAAKGTCKAGKCICIACKAGKDCKIVKQLKAGKGGGARFVVNAASDQDPLYRSMINSQWSSGAVVQVHSAVDAGNTDSAFSAPTGSVSAVAVGQNRMLEEPMPYTNCSSIAQTAPKVCKLNCLKRVQAKRCCGLDIPMVTNGRYGPMSFKDPDNNDIPVTSPTLGCNLLDPALLPCFARQTQRLSEGTICLDGAATYKTSYFGSFVRTGWYEGESDTNGNGIADQEEKQQQITKQCVWKMADGGDSEPNYGKECSSDGDCSSSNGKQGVCFEAYRAYCPPMCNELKFSVDDLSLSPFSAATLKLLAAEELALTTYQASTERQQGARRWKPRCAPGENTPDCFTDGEAQDYVKRNYAMIQIDYLKFEETVTSRGAAMDPWGLLGTVGGNLGMWVGMSIMTILEWVEFLFFLVLSIPFFLFGIKLPHVQKKADPPYDAEVEEALQRIKAYIAREKKRNNTENRISGQIVHVTTFPPGTNGNESVPVTAKN